VRRVLSLTLPMPVVLVIYAAMLGALLSGCGYRVSISRYVPHEVTLPLPTSDTGVDQ